MKINPVNSNITFKRIVETFRSDTPKEPIKEPIKGQAQKLPSDDKGDIYETTVTYMETVKVPKGDKQLPQFNYLV